MTYSFFRQLSNLLLAYFSSVSAVNAANDAKESGKDELYQALADQAEWQKRLTVRLLMNAYQPGNDNAQLSRLLKQTTLCHLLVR